MNPINDNDLILYHYRDGLDAPRLAEIEAALAESTALRARYERLCRLLGSADAEPTAPAAGFEQRLWAGLERRMAGDAVAARKPAWSERLRDWLGFGLSPRLLWAGGFASALVIALGIGFLAGRNVAPVPVAVQPSAGSTMASRVLDGYVAGHLRATEGLLLTAINEEGGDLLGGNRELAKSLVQSNRLYAAAAARSGNLRLADFLRQLEPVLLEVANQPDSSNVEDMQGLRDYLRETDLLFQVRATESRIDVASKRSL